MTCAQPVGEVDPQRTAGGLVNVALGKSQNDARVQFIDSLSEDLGAPDSLQFAVYTLELRDNRGHTAGFSNCASVPLAPTHPAEGLHAELDARGVYLIWDGEMEAASSLLQFDYRMYRREKGSSTSVAVPYLRAQVHTREGTRWTGVDTTINWEKTFTYWITPVTRIYSQGGQLLGEIEGDDAMPIEITTHNVFPPAAPERLLVLVSWIPGKKFVDLTWGPNAEKDLAGYNVYRREDGGPMAKVNSKPITMLSFQDGNVVRGQRYFYSLSAVDVRGNESAKSPEVTDVVP